MNTTLSASVPLSSPYTQDRATVILSPENVVDWVKVELRDKNDSTSVIASKSEFVLSNGNVVDLNGTSPVSFQLSADDYFITVTHRNHLAVMSNATVPIN